MKKIFWFDVETTGRNPYQNDIVELACLIEIDKQVVDKKSWKMQPVSYENIDEEALEITGKTLTEIKGYPPSPQIFLELQSFLNKYVDKYDREDKLYPAGYNIIKFDFPFLKNLFSKHEHKYFGSYFNYYCIDVYPLVAAYKYFVGDDFSPDNFKLSTVASSLRINVNEGALHSALYDIELTRKVFLKLGEDMLVGDKLDSDKYLDEFKDDFSGFENVIDNNNDKDISSEKGSPVLLSKTLNDDIEELF